MEGKDENKPKIVYFILAVFIHANVFLPFLSEKTGVHGAFILCDIILAIVVYNLMARNSGYCKDRLSIYPYSGKI